MKRFWPIMLALCLAFTAFSRGAMASSSRDGYDAFVELFQEEIGTTPALTKDDNPSAVTDKINLIISPSLGMVGVSSEKNGDVICSTLWTPVEPKKQMQMLLDLCHRYSEYTSEYGSILIMVLGLYDDELMIESADDASSFTTKLESEEEYWLKCLITQPADNSEITAQKTTYFAEFEPVNINKVSFSASDWVGTPLHRAVFATLMLLDFSIDFTISDSEAQKTLNHSAYVGYEKENSCVYLCFTSGTTVYYVGYMPGQDFEVPCYGLGWIEMFHSSTTTNLTEELFFESLMTEQCDEVFEVTQSEIQEIVHIIADGYQ